MIALPCSTTDPAITPGRELRTRGPSGPGEHATRPDGPEQPERSESDDQSGPGDRREAAAASGGEFHTVLRTLSGEASSRPDPAEPGEDSPGDRRAGTEEDLPAAPDAPLSCWHQGALGPALLPTPLLPGTQGDGTPPLASVADGPGTPAGRPTAEIIAALSQAGDAWPLPPGKSAAPGTKVTSGLAGAGVQSPAPSPEAGEGTAPPDAHVPAGTAVPQAALANPVASDAPAATPVAPAALAALPLTGPGAASGIPAPRATGPDPSSPGPDGPPGPGAAGPEVRQESTGPEAAGVNPGAGAPAARTTAVPDEAPLPAAIPKPPPSGAGAAQREVPVEDRRGTTRASRSLRRTDARPDLQPPIGSEESPGSVLPSGAADDTSRLAPASRPPDAGTSSPSGSGQESDRRGTPTSASRESTLLTAAGHEPGGPSGAPEGGTAREAAAGRPALSPAGLQRVVSAARMSATGGGMQVRLTLHPDSLGEVLVQVRWERGALTARLDATTPEARAALEGGLPSLRTALADQGVSVERLQVGLQLGPDAQAQRHASPDREAAALGRRPEDATPPVVTPVPLPVGTSRLDVRV